ncbi:lipoprotein signal peptidase [Hymenobacter cellulosivorans]|uniref:Lipoprotein signal peptidase n=1 Tax=Hymenobacter cellulosivorans TaxID=2932249 RepID=A0ABY4FDM2_9BACT|nr:lipoprotein signal peptidase [Hymenobacter cellulosivorans]UOQ54147.1 lipoprotein signal peptidase [Hymenobacter cellulosivorans]
MKYWKYYLLALLVIVIDQLSKWAVHTYMEPGMAGEISLFGDWGKLHYTLNPGMAFGVELPPPYGKILLTSFRLVAMVGISYYIYKLWQRRAFPGFIACVALILGGAVGNLIDSIFYGIIYDNAPFGVPTPWFHGQVIDMLFVDFPDGFFPISWPLIGGKVIPDFPIFNIADSCIFIGVVLILLNQNKFFAEEQAANHVAQDAEVPRRDAETSEVV